MQTPQTFRYSEILSAYERGAANCTDDAEVYAAAGYSPRLIEGNYDNIKITVASDLYRSLPRSCRIGAGFDVHRLVKNRPLILGGVNIEYDLGLDGHSDADVLTHAIMDALLSAAGLPDIGVLFPDTDDKFLGASSIELLKDVTNRVKKTRTDRRKYFGGSSGATPQARARYSGNSQAFGGGYEYRSRANKRFRNDDGGTGDYR